MVLQFKVRMTEVYTAAKKELYNTSGVGKVIIIMKISMYLLTVTPTNHTNTF